jgi:hypothetical protein
VSQLEEPAAGNLHGGVCEGGDSGASQYRISSTRRRFNQDMSVTLVVLGFRLALPHKRQDFSARARRRSILSNLRRPVEQKHEPRATLFSGIKAVQRVQ